MDLDLHETGFMSLPFCESVERPLPWPPDGARSDAKQS